MVPACPSRTKLVLFFRIEFNFARRAENMAGVPLTNPNTDDRETRTLNLRMGPWNIIQGVFLPAVAVWLSGTGKFKMQPPDLAKVGIKVESVVSCPGGGPFMEEGDG